MSCTNQIFFLLSPDLTTLGWPCSPDLRPRLTGPAPCRTCALLDPHLAEPVPRRTPLGLPLGRASELEVLSGKALELGVPSGKAPSWRSRRAGHRSCARTGVTRLRLAEPMSAPYAARAAPGLAKQDRAPEVWRSCTHAGAGPRGWRGRRGQAAAAACAHLRNSSGSKRTKCVRW